MLPWPFYRLIEVIIMLIKNRIHILPALLLVLNFTVQFYHYQQSNLSAWSGGGFGMFSTADTPMVRQFTLWKDIESSPKLLSPIAQLERDNLVNSFKALPTDHKLELILKKFNIEKKPIKAFLFRPVFHNQKWNMIKIYEK